MASGKSLGRNCFRGSAPENVSAYRWAHPGGMCDAKIHLFLYIVTILMHGNGRTLQ